MADIGVIDDLVEPLGGPSGGGLGSDPGLLTELVAPPPTADTGGVQDLVSPLGGPAAGAPGEPQPVADPASPPPYEYSWDFTYGMGPWTTWLPPSVVTEAGGEYEQFTRIQAPGPLDANHIDGVGAIWLVSHLSIPTLGSPGILNLHDAEFEITVRGTDFQANGGKLAIWLCRYVPETGLLENFYVGLQVTNWANTGGDMMGEVTDDWSTITLKISDDPADWTYAGNYHSYDGEWADRYVPFDLQETLSHVDATLHLVILNPDADDAPTGFLDLANITVRTQTPATPVGVSGRDPETHYGLEDQVSTGHLTGSDAVDMDHATFSLVSGSVTKGTITIDPDTGAFIFTPPADYYGPTDYVGAATFQYVVSDGVNTSDPITVLMYIGGINDAPLISTRNEDVDIAGGQPFEFTLFKGEDIDGDVLTFKIVPDSVVGGTIELDARSGRYVFTPTPGFTGEASFRYTVSDGHVDSGEKSVELTVHAGGDAPVLPSYGAVEQLLIGGDMAAFVYWIVQLADAGNTNAAYHYGTWLNSGINGITKDKELARHYLEMAANLVPDANFQLAQLYISGEGGDKDYVHARELLEALGDHNVNAVYRLAILDDLGFGIAAPDKAGAVEGYLAATKMGSAEAAYTLGRRYLSGEGVAESASDAYFWLGVGLKFNAQPNYAQFRDLLTFNMNQAAESLTPQQIAALNAAIAAWDPGEASPVNDAPVLAGDDAVNGQDAPGQPITGALADATDSDGDHLTYQLVPNSTAGGTVAIDPETGAFVFTPTAGFSGTVSFTYVVSDGTTTTAPRTVSFEVEAGTTAAADAHATDEDATITVGAAAGLLANDYASSAGGSIVVSAVDGQAGAVGQAVTGDWGVLTVQADGSYVFVPSAAALNLLQGQVVTDTFTYTVRDQQGVSSTAELVITLNGRDGVVNTGSGVMLGSAFNDLLSGGSGHDVLLGLDGDDTLDGGSGAADELYGGRGDDTYLVNVGDTIIENADEGYDTVKTALNNLTLANNLEKLLFTGTGDFTGVGNAVDNWIEGGAGADLLIGLGGNDTLVGGSGAANQLYGGAGDDTYVVSVAADQVVEVSGEGYDTVRTALASLTLATNVEALVYTGSGAFNGTGNASDNNITGGLGADVLEGLAGNDVLIGGAGAANTLRGGLGDDIYVVDAVGDTIVENAGEGTDTVRTTVAAFTLAANVENLVYVGSGAFTGTGNASANVITGGAGDDVLAGRGGIDILTGGLGIDTVSYADAAAGVEVRLDLNQTRNDGDGASDVLSGFENATGSAFDDLLFGNAARNVLTGGLGRDTLLGFGGDDVLIGGDGAANTMQGGLGDDLYVVSANGDSIYEAAGEGTDTVQTSLATFTLGANIENLTYTGSTTFVGAGNALANVITGGTARDVLLGYGGNDVLVGGSGAANELYGGLGDDTYVVSVAGDTIIENAGEGYDTVQTALAAYTLRANLEVLTYTGTGAFAGTGNADANVINGGAGDDVLAGRGGVDTLVGGLGIDTASYANAAAGVTARLDLNRATNDGDGATDTFTGIENLTGSNFDDLLIGDAGNNVLSGGLGRDVLLGGAGDDILIGGSGLSNQLQGGAGNDTYVMTTTDTVVELAGEGVDTVQTTSGVYTLGANVENLTYIGTTVFTGTGNGLDNVISGGANNDVLKGAGGDDVLNGGSGVDIAVLTGLRDDYLVEVIDGGYRVTDLTAGRDGVDLLYGMETLRFGNGSTASLASLAAAAHAPLFEDKDAGPQAPPPSSALDDVLTRLHHDGNGMATIDELGHLIQPNDWIHGI